MQPDCERVLIASDLVIYDPSPCFLVHHLFNVFIHLPHLYELHMTDDHPKRFLSMYTLEHRGETIADETPTKSWQNKSKYQPFQTSLDIPFTSDNIYSVY